MRRPRPAPVRAVMALLAATALTLGLGLVAAPASAAPPIGTGAVSVKGPGSELISGATIEIRSDTCTGQAVWRTTTGATPSAYGAFGIGLAPGRYCIVTLAAPAPYKVAANVVFDMEARPANWVTVWLPGPTPAPATVNGALVAKDSTGTGINGVTALIREGSCDTTGRSVWLNTTATNRWSSGGFGISLAPGAYCATATTVPLGFDLPAPATVNVTTPGPAWITLWVPRATTFTGTGNARIPLDIAGPHVLDFSCSDCVGDIDVSSESAYVPSEEIFYGPVIDFEGPYSARLLIGSSFVGPPRRTLALDVRASGTWTIKLSPLRDARTVTDRASGDSEDVFRFTGSGSRVTYSAPTASYLVIFELDANGIQIPFTGDDESLEGTAQLSLPATIQVFSDGPWMISID